ncbi:hypothetical protein EV1_015105 [Malus domestica]
MESVILFKTHKCETKAHMQGYKVKQNDEWNARSDFKPYIVRGHRGVSPEFLLRVGAPWFEGFSSKFRITDVRKGFVVMKGLRRWWRCRGLL